KSPDAPSRVACTITVPLVAAWTTPSLDTVAIARLLIVYCVPTLAAVTFLVEPSGYRADTSSGKVAPGCVKVCVGPLMVSDVGIGVAVPNLMGFRLTTPLAGMLNRSDSPEVVVPSTVQVA